MNIDQTHSKDCKTAKFQKSKKEEDFTAFWTNVPQAEKENRTREIKSHEVAKAPQSQRLEHF